MVSNELKQNIGEETSLKTIESLPQAHNVLHKKHHESLVTSSTSVSVHCIEWKWVNEGKLKINWVEAWAFLQTNINWIQEKDYIKQKQEHNLREKCYEFSDFDFDFTISAL